jgi:hypothetical protein
LLGKLLLNAANEDLQAGGGHVQSSIILFTSFSSFALKSDPIAL